MSPQEAGGGRGGGAAAAAGGGEDSTPTGGVYGLKGSSSMTKKYTERSAVDGAPYLSLPPWRAASINKTWEPGESISG